MKESNVWKWIREHPSAFVAIERMETLHPPGMSDCYFTVLTEARPRPNVSGWLELKYCEPDDKAYRSGFIPKLRPAQPMFLTRQWQRGVPCGIFLRVGNVKSHVWTPTGDPSWNHEIRSARAIGMASKTWDGMPENLWKLVLTLFPL